MAKSRPTFTIASSGGSPVGDSSSADDAPALQPSELRIGEFAERIADRTGMRRADARAAASAALEVLGDALRSGEEMRLTGLGKIRIVGSKAGEKRRVLTVKVIMDAAKDPLADPGEDV
ncbi:hypothetical protein GCM10011392_20590 [Wenxinia marina]|uniref:Bacterial nucleoid DNA-binding protein n=2 Tax=Wenxinia TaxID=653686 RepID=A0A0D0Q8N3_9RHOB|nr:Bacterial nucleoid DNA-binding protein [Wenxinia marina DSM 24838]GGL65837.1 hypothetical protein GCM10011392_20590 [Wenxinia marina]